MLAALPIAASLLAVLNDNDDAVDFDELFQRAMMFDNPDIFWSRIDDKNEAVQKLTAYFVPTLQDLEWPQQEKLVRFLTNDGDIGNSSVLKKSLVWQIEKLTMASTNLEELQGVIRESSEPWLEALSSITHLEKPFAPLARKTVNPRREIVVPVFSDRIEIVDNLGYENHRREIASQKKLKISKSATFVDVKDKNSGLVRRFVDNEKLLRSHPAVWREIIDEIREDFCGEKEFFVEDATFIVISWDEDRILAYEYSLRSYTKTFLLNLKGSS